MRRRWERPSKGPELEQADYDRLALELAASLRLYLQLLALNPFSPEVVRLMRDAAREIAQASPQDDAPLH